MKIAFLTAGAAGMYCGSCMRDNTLVTALIGQGHDATLIPTYMPIRTDEVDVSHGKVFYGGVNVFLQDRSRLFRHAPHFVDRMLNHPRLLRAISRRARAVNYADFAGLTVSMLKGTDGRQRKELAKLVEWLAADLRPEVVILTNALLSGVVPAIRQKLGVPVWVTLQGDDIFLNALPERARTECIAAIRHNDRHVAGYIATSLAYADEMAAYLGVDRAKIVVVYPGLNLKGYGRPDPGPAAQRPPTLGFFARICPEKGFHNAVSAWLKLRQMTDAPAVRFRASGWLGEQNLAYFADQVRRIHDAGLAGDFDHAESPDHASKVRFYHSIDVMTLPTDYKEPKGLPVLEAWANGVPVVQPDHGSFPELIDATGGGLLYPAGDADALARQLHRLFTEPALRARLGRAGFDGVRERFTAAHMAEATVRVLASNP